MLGYLDMTRLLLSHGASVEKSVCKEALVSITLSVLTNLQRSCRYVEMHQQGPTKQFDSHRMLHHSQWHQVLFDRLLAHLAMHAHHSFALAVNAMHSYIML